MVNNTPLDPYPCIMDKLWLVRISPYRQCTHGVVPLCDLTDDVVGELPTRGHPYILCGFVCVWFVTTVCRSGVNVRHHIGFAKFYLFDQLVWVHRVLPRLYLFDQLVRVTGFAWVAFICPTRLDTEFAWVHSFWWHMMVWSLCWLAMFRLFIIMYFWYIGFGCLMLYFYSYQFTWHIIDGATFGA